MFLASFIVGLICLTHAAQAENNLREQPKTSVGRDDKHLEGSPYQQTLLTGYSSGFVNLNWYYSTTATATCGTPASQVGFLIGVCTPVTAALCPLPSTYTSAGCPQTPKVTTGTGPTYYYKSKLTQIAVGTCSTSAVVAAAANPYVGTSSPATGAGLVTLYFSDEGCDPQYYIPELNYYDTVANLHLYVNTEVKSSYSSTTGFLQNAMKSVNPPTATTSSCVCVFNAAGVCVSTTTGTPAVTTYEYLSVSCTALPNGVTNPLSLSWSNPLTILPVNTVPAPFFSNFIYYDPSSTTACNKTMVNWYSYIQASTQGAPVCINAFGVVPTSASSNYVSAYIGYNGAAIYAGGNSYTSCSSSFPTTTLGQCGAPGSVTAVSTYYSNPGYSLSTAAPTETIISSAIVQVFWYPNPAGLKNDPNFCSTLTTFTSTAYTPQFQYSINLGYCYPTTTGSYKYQIGSYPATTSTTAYELVQISYTDTACTMNPIYTDLTFNTILPFLTTPTNIVTSGATCFPATKTPQSGSTIPPTYAYDGFYTVTITPNPTSAQLSIGLTGSLFSIPTSMAPYSVFSQYFFQDSSTAYAGSPTCTKPLYALNYVVNTCLNINTAGYYQFGVAQPAGLLTPYSAVYVNSVPNSAGSTVNTFYYYTSYGTCMLDTVKRCSTTSTGWCVAKSDPVISGSTTPGPSAIVPGQLPTSSGQTDQCLINSKDTPSVINDILNSFNYELTYTPGGVTTKNFGSGYYQINWYQSCMDTFSTTCCSASPKYQYGGYYGYCLPVYGVDGVTKVGSYMINLDTSAAGTTVKGYMKTTFTDLACTSATGNPVTSYYPFSIAFNTASTCQKFGTVPYDGYYTMNIVASSPNVAYGGTFSPPAPVTVSAPFFSVYEFSQYSKCGQTKGFNYYSLNTCLNMGVTSTNKNAYTTTAYYFATVNNQADGVPSYAFYQYTTTNLYTPTPTNPYTPNAVEACVIDIMTNGAPTPPSSAPATSPVTPPTSAPVSTPAAVAVVTTLDANKFDTCVNTNPLVTTNVATTSQWKLTYATVAQSVSAGKNPFGSNGWFSIYQYFDEGCQSQPLAQADWYLGYCIKQTSPTTGQVLYSYKYQLGDTNCASGNFLKVTYSDALCTQNPIVTNVPLSTYLPTNSLKCTRNDVGGYDASAFFTAKCTPSSSTVMPTSFPQVAVPSPYNSFTSYQQNQSTPLLSNFLLGSTPQCITPLMAASYTPNMCLFDFYIAGTTVYYANVGSRLMKYQYPSYSACMQDPNPKCSVISTSYTQGTITNVQGSSTNPASSITTSTDSSNSGTSTSSTSGTPAVTTTTTTNKGSSTVTTSGPVTTVTKQTSTTQATGTASPYNAFCTAMVDVTPSGYCFTDNQANNQLYKYVGPGTNSNVLSGGAIAGIVIGCVVFALLICVAVFILMKGRGGGGGASSA